MKNLQIDDFQKHRESLRIRFLRFIQKTPSRRAMVFIFSFCLLISGMGQFLFPLGSRAEETAPWPSHPPPPPWMLAGLWVAKDQDRVLLFNVIFQPSRISHLIVEQRDIYTLEVLAEGPAHWKAHRLLAHLKRTDQSYTMELKWQANGKDLIATIQGNKDFDLVNASSPQSQIDSRYATPSKEGQEYIFKKWTSRPLCSSRTSPQMCVPWVQTMK